MTTKPAPVTASVLDVVARIPWRSASSAARSSRRTVATISSGIRHPVLKRPTKSASPIFPAPRIAIRRGSAAMARSLRAELEHERGHRREARRIEPSVRVDRRGLDGQRARVPALRETREEPLEVERTFAREQVAPLAVLTEPPVEVLQVHVVDERLVPEPVFGHGLAELSVEAEELRVERDPRSGVPLDRKANVRERPPDVARDRLDGKREAVCRCRVDAGR